MERARTLLRGVLTREGVHTGSTVCTSLIARVDNKEKRVSNRHST